MKQIDLDQIFQQINRGNFVRPVDKNNAELDMPLPIGFGQTISQPYTVRLMLEWLYPKSGDKVLDVGSGSGWTTALLAKIVGPKGKVYATELIPELVEFGRKNCQKLHIKNATFYQSGETLGLPEFAPFDRILVSASAREFPKELLDQLAPNGKLVIPVRDSILEIPKDRHGEIEIIEHPGFVFVPLVN